MYSFTDNYCLFLLKIIKIYLFVVSGAMAAASALAGPKSLTALPMVRHPNVSLQSPGTKVQTASLIRSTTPPTSKSPTPGVTISVTQASEGAR